MCSSHSEAAKLTSRPRRNAPALAEVYPQCREVANVDQAVAVEVRSQVSGRVEGGLQYNEVVEVHRVVITGVPRPHEPHFGGSLRTPGEGNGARDRQVLGVLGAPVVSAAGQAAHGHREVAPGVGELRLIVNLSSSAC